jgi:hypothetical protein
MKMARAVNKNAKTIQQTFSHVRMGNRTTIITKESTKRIFNRIIQKLPEKRKK